MFSLIITIITIALVAALAISSIYYGGDAFNSGSTQAAASTIVNQAQQIAAASDMFRAQNAGRRPANIAALTDEQRFLQSAPILPDGYFTGESGGAWTIDATEGRLQLTNVSPEICHDETDDAIGGAEGTDLYYCDNGTFTFAKQLFTKS